MGGSLALALKKSTNHCNVSAVVRTEERQKEAQSYSIVDEIFIEQRFLSENRWNEFDFIIFALPVDKTCEKIKLIPKHYNGFITDLGSSKTAIVQTVEKKYNHSEHNYLSSHPMTGSEFSGLRYAREDLYENKLCILTPIRGVTEEALEKISTFWNDLGSKTITINSVEHDEILSFISHAPHILSSLLAEWIGENEKVIHYTKQSPIPLTGGGFRDMSRIAGSNPEMWDAIINTNREFIYSGLLTFRDKLSELIDELNPKNNSKNDQHFWKEYFRKSKKYRDKILKLIDS